MPNVPAKKNATYEDLCMLQSCIRRAARLGV